MSYSFSGFFIKNRQINSATFREGHVYRKVTDPFVGCGILTPDMKPSFSDCINYLSSLGVSDSDWIFVDYQTWAAHVDYVLAIGSRAGKPFGPIEGDGDPAEEAFDEALYAFGLREGAGIFFAPFERGFWGDI